MLMILYWILSEQGSASLPKQQPRVLKKTNERIAVFISRRRISAPPAFAGIAIIAALIAVGRLTRMVKMK